MFFTLVLFAVFDSLSPIVVQSALRKESRYHICPPCLPETNQSCDSAIQTRLADLLAHPMHRLSDQFDIIQI